MLPSVQKARDFIQKSVKRYVRRLPGQKDDDYLLYKEGAYYLPAIGRTQDAFVGMIMEPLPQVKGQVEAHKPFLDDLTSDGEPFSRVCQTIVSEVIESGRGAVLVDYPQADEGLTVSEAQAAGLRPYAAFYKFEDIINWKTGNVGGRKMLTQIRLVESYEVLEDEWDSETEEQIRVLDLIEGQYRVRIFRKVSAEQKDAQTSQAQKQAKAIGEKGAVGTVQSEEWLQYGEDYFPKRKNKPMTEIPIVVFGPASLDPSRVDEPPLCDMVEIAESHLNDSALRQWAIMWCGAPTLVIAGGLEDEQDEDGKDKEPEPIKIGSSVAIELGEGGTAQLLEMKGESVGAIKESMDDKRRDMAAVGARVLSDTGSSNISTETALLERVGEHSVLSGIANTVADGMGKILKYLFEWADVPTENIAVELNTSFVPAGLKPGELKEWIEAVMTGNMPRSVFIARMKEKGAVDSSMTEAEWAKKLDEEADDLSLGNGDELDDEKGGGEGGDD
jgi:hypothetical protein